MRDFRIKVIFTLFIISVTNVAPTVANAVENCTDKNWRSTSTAKFTNLEGLSYSVSAPYELDSQFSRAYLIDETTRVDISTLYEGSNCLATVVTRSVNAKEQFLPENEVAVDKFLSQNDSDFFPKTYEEKLNAKRFIQRLKEELLSSKYASSNIEYQSRESAGQIGRKNIVSDLWQNPLYDLQKRMGEIIDSEYRLLNDNNRYGEYYKYKSLFLNLRLNSSDGCFAYYKEQKDSGVVTKLYSSGIPGPNYFWAYYFEKPYSNTLQCKVSISLYNSEFSVGNLILIPQNKVSTSVKSIICIKGKTLKMLSGANPKCPAGYKKKS